MKTIVAETKNTMIAVGLLVAGFWALQLLHVIIG